MELALYLQHNFVLIKYIQVMTGQTTSCGADGIAGR